MIKNRNTYRIIGVLICIISIYWLIHNGIHLINYTKIGGGLENNEFGYSKSYNEIILIFMFWIIQTIGGLGLIKTSKTGLKIGLITTIMSGILSIIYTVFISFDKLEYSTIIFVNGVEREMTLIEKLKIIYAEPFSYFILSMIIISILILIIKGLKTIENKDKTPAYNNV